MGKTFSDVFGSARNFWANISASQRLLIVGLATILVGVFFALLVWMGKPELSVLYSNLSSEDANRVLKSLEAQRIPFSLAENGTAIMVPADKVHALRIGLAGDNVLTGQGVGFEIFNEVNVGQTDFVQRLNYRRALEGELARTINEFPSVEAARVHLVLPHRSLFLEEQKTPSASVLLKLSGTGTMDKKDVQAIVNLVSMAVEGLDKAHIAIADTSGKVLFQPDMEGSLDGLTQTQYEHKVRMQQSLERRVEELLMPVIGAGRIIARVNADLDFSQRTIRKELYDPEVTVLRSEQRSEESSQGRANIESGVPDPNFRGDGPTGTASTTTSNRETRTNNFEINKEEHSIVPNVGEISRLSVAVIVDGSYEKNAEGVEVFVPRTEDEIKRIRQLVASAVGFDSARGDVIEVSNIAFGGVEIAEDQPVAMVIADYALRFGRPLLNAVLIFLFLVLVVRPVVLALVRPKVEGKMVEGLEGLPQNDEPLALIDDSDEAMAASIVLEKIEDIKAHTLQLSEQNMDQAIGIIKSWLKEKPTDAKVPAKAA